MTALRKKSSPRPISPSSARCTCGSSPSAASADTTAGRTNSACSVCSELRSVGSQRRIRVRFQPFVGDLAQPVVRVAQQTAHEIAGAAIVERRQHDERAVPDELVAMLLDRLDERRHRLGRRQRRIVRAAFIRVG